MYKIKMRELRYTERFTFFFDDDVVQVDAFDGLSSQVGNGGYPIFLALYFTVVPTDENCLIEVCRGFFVINYTSCPNVVDIGVVFFLARR